MTPHTSPLLIVYSSLIQSTHHFWIGICHLVVCICNVFSCMFFSWKSGFWNTGFGFGNWNAEIWTGMQKYPIIYRSDPTTRNPKYPITYGLAVNSVGVRVLHYPPDTRSGVGFWAPTRPMLTPSGDSCR